MNEEVSFEGMQPIKKVNGIDDHLFIGNQIKRFLSKDEINDLDSIGICWKSAVFTGSRFFGTHAFSSDFDIFLNYEESGKRVKEFIKDGSIPLGWEDGRTIDENPDYPDSSLNIKKDRLNLFVLDDKHYRIYKDATFLCKDGGNRSFFIKFVCMARARGWYNDKENK